MAYRHSPERTVLCTLILIGLLGSCANQKDVSFKSGGMTQTIAEGKDAIPKDFPLPIYPGATTSGSVSASGKDDESQFLMLSTVDPIDKVSQFYQLQLKDKGWEIDSVNTEPKIVSIDAHKGTVQANALLADDSGKTTISLQLGKASDVKDDSESSSENYHPDKVTPPTD